MSPSDRWQNVQQKIEEYFGVEVHQVWVVEPDNQRVLIYDTPTSLHKFESGDVIKGEGILEGFTLNVTEIICALGVGLSRGWSFIQIDPSMRSRHLYLQKS